MQQLGRLDEKAQLRQMFKHNWIFNVFIETVLNDCESNKQERTG
jgi:hypothetical protein